MRKKLGYASAFTSGQALEVSLATSSIFNKDKGLHLMGYKIEIGKKSTVIDNMSVYGDTFLLLECKNYIKMVGKIDEPFWKATGKRQTYRILNPLKQNAYHRKMITLHMQDNNIKQTEYKIQDYVVVPDDCELIISDTTKKFVLYESELKGLKKSLSAKFNTVSPTLTKIIRRNV